MTATDGVLAVLAIIGLAVFLSVLIIYVPKPALVIVCVATILMAVFDFVREFHIARRNSIEKR